jgi:serine/threonine protein kinase
VGEVVQNLQRWPRAVVAPSIEEPCALRLHAIAAGPAHMVRGLLRAAISSTAPLDVLRSSMVVDSKSPCELPSSTQEWLKARVGTDVGLKHRIVRLLANGGMSHVFLAEHVEDGTHAVAKLCAPDSDIPPVLLDQEAWLIGSIHHPHVVRVIDSGRTVEGGAYLLLELVHGIDLEEWLRRTRAPMSPSTLLQVLSQLALAVDALHELGLVHSDIKPANVMFDANAQNSVKLIDFGLAFDCLDARTRRGSAGTPGYMAPEQLRGEVCGPAIDRFAVAALAFELLTGKALQPWATLSLIRARAWARTAPLDARDGISPELEQVFGRALHDRPAARFHTAVAFVEALTSALRRQVAREPSTGSDRAASYSQAHELRSAS